MDAARFRFFIAIGLVGLLAAPFAPDTETMLLAVSLGTVLLLAAFVGRVRRPRDRYDLRRLREIDDAEESIEIVEPDPEDYASVQCLCGHVYDARLPVCPDCRRPQSRLG